MIVSIAIDARDIEDNEIILDRMHVLDVKTPNLFVRASTYRLLSILFDD